MSLKHTLVGHLNLLLKLADVRIVRDSAYQQLLQKATPHSGPSARASALPPGAKQYLRADHPRLGELRNAYRASGLPPADPSQWTDSFISTDLDLRYFRGDNAYVWQRRDQHDEIRYVLSAYYARTIDGLGLLHRLDEDGLFGVFTYHVGHGLTVSRDLLDSIVEIHFLLEHLDLNKRSSLAVLDIGAGYGRLAHRMVQGLDFIDRYLCTDAVAESTFVSEYYIKFRGIDDRARAVPLTEIEQTLEETPIDLAINIHSFSECTLASTAWWLDLLGRHRVPYLMIVPNTQDHQGTRLMTCEKDGRHLDFMPAIESAGYRLLVRKPKYKDPSVQKHGVFPTYFYLFEYR